MQTSSHPAVRVIPERRNATSLWQAIKVFGPYLAGLVTVFAAGYRWYEKTNQAIALNNVYLGEIQKILQVSDPMILAKRVEILESSSTIHGSEVEKKFDQLSGRVDRVNDTLVDIKVQLGKYIVMQEERESHR